MSRFDRRSHQFQRRAARLDVRPKIILACEGKRTEPIYLAELIRTERIAVTFNIVFAPHRGTDPLSIIRTAMNARQTERANGLWRPGDSVWAIYDGEEHRANSEERWYQAIQAARDESIYLAISNPCIELWFLLHFEDCFAVINRAQALRGLRAHIADYEKSKSIYERHLKERTRAAIERAGKMTKIAQESGKQPYENPHAGISDLIARLLSLP